MLSSVAPSVDGTRDELAKVGAPDKGAAADPDARQRTGGDHPLEGARGETKRLGGPAQGQQLDRRALPE